MLWWLLFNILHICLCKKLLFQIPCFLGSSHCASAPQTQERMRRIAHWGPLSQEVFDNNETSGAVNVAMLSAARRVTSPSSPADATPLKRGSQRQLACDVVLLFDCRRWVALYASEMCHVTQSALWTTRTPEMTFLTQLDIGDWFFSASGLNGETHRSTRGTWGGK